MSWETRRKPSGSYGRYYTRTRRVDGRSIRVYLGQGDAAEAAAEEDAARQADKAAATAARKDEEARWRALNDEVVRATALIDIFAAGALLAAGCQFKHRYWSRPEHERPQ
jgi:hypothetical protein